MYRVFRFISCYISERSELTPEGMQKNKLHEGMRGRVNRTPPSIFKSIQSIDMKLGMCDKCPVYFQLSIAWHLIGFHGNHSNIMTSLVAAILDFQIFKYFSYSKLNTGNSENTTFSDWNPQNYKIYCKIISI